MSKKIDLYDGGTGQRTPGRPHPAGHIVMPHPEKINVNADAPSINRGDGIGRHLEDKEMGMGKGFDAKPRPGSMGFDAKPRAGASMGTADGQYRPTTTGPMAQSGQRSNVVRAARIGHLSGGETNMRVPASRIDADVEPEYQPMGSHKVTGSAGDKTP